MEVVDEDGWTGMHWACAASATTVSPSLPLCCPPRSLLARSLAPSRSLSLVPNIPLSSLLMGQTDRAHLTLPRAKIDVAFRFSQAVSALVAAGASVTAKDKQGGTPVELAGVNVRLILIQVGPALCLGAQNAMPGSERGHVRQ